MIDKELCPLPPLVDLLSALQIIGHRVETSRDTDWLILTMNTGVEVYLICENAVIVWPDRN